MKKSQTILIGILIFYIVAGIFAALFFFKNGSLLSHRLTPDTAVISSSVVGTIDEKPEEPVPEPQPEPVITEKPVFEPETAPEPEAPRAYYKCTVATSRQRLNIRKTPDMNEEILGRLKKGAVAYILELGDEWSLITTGEYTGYCFNEYLQINEIPKEEFPAEYITD